MELLMGRIVLLMSLVQVLLGNCTSRVEVTVSWLVGVREIIISLVGLETVFGLKVIPQLLKKPISTHPVPAVS